MSENPVRQLPAQSPPVETGPIRFGNDKAGVFIRGDNALGFSMALRNLLESPLSSIWVGAWQTEMEILLLLLESCRADKKDDALAG